MRNTAADHVVGPAFASDRGGPVAGDRRRVEPAPAVHRPRPPRRGRSGRVRRPVRCPRHGQLGPEWLAGRLAHGAGPLRSGHPTGARPIPGRDRGPGVRGHDAGRTAGRRRGRDHRRRVRDRVGRLGGRGDHPAAPHRPPGVLEARRQRRRVRGRFVLPRRRHRPDRIHLHARDPRGRPRRRGRPGDRGRRPAAPPCGAQSRPPGAVEDARDGLVRRVARRPGRSATRQPGPRAGDRRRARLVRGAGPDRGRPPAARTGAHRRQRGRRLPPPDLHDTGAPGHALPSRRADGHGGRRRSRRGVRGVQHRPARAIDRPPPARVDGDLRGCPRRVDGVLDRVRRRRPRRQRAGRPGPVADGVLRPCGRRRRRRRRGRRLRRVGTGRSGASRPRRGHRRRGGPAAAPTPRPARARHRPDSGR